MLRTSGRRGARPSRDGIIFSDIHEPTPTLLLILRQNSTTADSHPPQSFGWSTGHCARPLPRQSTPALHARKPSKSAESGADNIHRWLRKRCNCVPGIRVGRLGPVKNCVSARFIRFRTHPPPRGFGGFGLAGSNSNAARNGGLGGCGVPPSGPSINPSTFSFSSPRPPAHSPLPQAGHWFSPALTDAPHAGHLSPTTDGLTG